MGGGLCRKTLSVGDAGVTAMRTGSAGPRGCEDAGSAPGPGLAPWQVHAHPGSSRTSDGMQGSALLGISRHSHLSSCPVLRAGSRPVSQTPDTASLASPAGFLQGPYRRAPPLLPEGGGLWLSLSTRASGSAGTWGCPPICGAPEHSPSVQGAPSPPPRGSLRHRLLCSPLDSRTLGLGPRRLWP